MQTLKNEVRNNIYKSALIEFSEKGYEKASMRKIADRAKITVGNMYRYFKNKEDLFYSVISPAYQKLTQFITEQNITSNIDKAKENYNIDNQANKFVDIYMEHKAELIIIIEGSKGSKYEGAKDETIKLVESIIKKMLIAKSLENTSIYNDPYFIHVLSVSVAEGVIMILKQYEGESKIREMVQNFIGLIFKDFEDRIK